MYILMPKLNNFLGNWKLFVTVGAELQGSAYIYRMTGLLMDDDTTLVSWRIFFKTPPTRHELLLGTLILKYELAGQDLHQISGQRVKLLGTTKILT